MPDEGPGGPGDRTAESPEPPDTETRMQFFADGEERRSTAGQSVFRSVDQTDVLSRLGEGAIEDDYADPFFDHGLLSAEVPTRSIDAGIQAVVQAPRRTASPVRSTDDGLGPTASARLASDQVARRRFILEGPASLTAED